MKHDEQIKIDNFKAQYNSILGNIKIANHELEIALERKTKAMVGISDLELQLKEMSLKVSTLQNIYKDTKLGINSTLQKLEKEKEQMVNFKLSLDDDIKKSNKKIKEEKTFIELSIVQTKEELNILLSKESVLKESISVFEKNNNILDTENQNLKTDNKKITQESKELSFNINDNEAKYNKDLEIRKAILQDLRDKISAEQKKVGVADKNIMERWTQIAEREKNLAIYTRRLRDLYTEIYPGITLNV